MTRSGLQSRYVCQHGHDLHSTLLLKSDGDYHLAGVDDIDPGAVLRNLKPIWRFSG